MRHYNLNPIWARNPTAYTPVNIMVLEEDAEKFENVMRALRNGDLSAIEVFNRGDGTMIDAVPNPGSDEAVKQGCICPRMDNHYGKGCYDDGELFWINQNCPLHGQGVKKE